ELEPLVAELEGAIDELAQGGAGDTTTTGRSRRPVSDLATPLAYVAHPDGAEQLVVRAGDGEAPRSGSLPGQELAPVGLGERRREHHHGRALGGVQGLEEG